MVQAIPLRRARRRRACPWAAMAGSYSARTRVYADRLHSSRVVFGGLSSHFSAAPSGLQRRVGVAGDLALLVGRHEADTVGASLRWRKNITQLNITGRSAAPLRGIANYAL